MQQHTVIYEGELIIFQLSRKPVKNVNLRIRSDFSIAVSASPKVPLPFIESIVLKKAPWILNTLKRNMQINESQAAADYISGEIIHYRGKPFTLQVHEADNEAVSVQAGEMVFAVKPGSKRNERELLFLNWLKSEAEVLFPEALERMHHLVKNYSIPKPIITIRAMKTRWGSCSWKKGRISLNVFLLYYPPECLDYVVLHELAHFKHQRHDQKFYDFLGKLMPDWHVRKKMLKSNYCFTGNGEVSFIK